MDKFRYLDLPEGWLFSGRDTIVISQIWRYFILVKWLHLSL
jgi:hypothetical protein